MVHEVDSLIAGYERGTLSRRDLVGALVSLAAVGALPGRAAAQRPAPRGVSLNHVSLAVSDVARAQRFYEQTLGLTEVSRQSNGVNLGLGDSFLGLYDIPASVGSIHHFCVGVAGYEIARTADELRALGIEPRIRQDRPELYFADPDGVTVQLSEPEYRG